MGDIELLSFTTSRRVASLISDLSKFISTFPLCVKLWFKVEMLIKQNIPESFLKGRLPRRLIPKYGYMTNKAK